MIVGSVAELLCKSCKASPMANPISGSCSTLGPELALIVARTWAESRLSGSGVGTGDDAGCRVPVERSPTKSAPTPKQNGEMRSATEA